MSTLHLTLKKKYFDMILSGFKPEEYREIKPHWIKRLLSNIEHLTSVTDIQAVGARFKTFDTVIFVNGYGADKPTLEVEFKGIRIGEGNPSWGAPPQDVFIISLGKIISHSPF